MGENSEITGASSRTHEVSSGADIRYEFGVSIVSRAKKLSSGFVFFRQNFSVFFSKNRVYKPPNVRQLTRTARYDMVKSKEIIMGNDTFASVVSELENAIRPLGFRIESHGVDSRYFPNDDGEFRKGAPPDEEWLNVRIGKLGQSPRAF